MDSGTITEPPPPSYEEALEIIRRDESSKLPGTVPSSDGEVHVIPLETLRGNPSKLVQPAPPQYATAVQDATASQATTTDASRAIVTQEASHLSLKYPRCFNCFMGPVAEPLPPTLRKAWVMGMKIVSTTANIGNIPRYLFLAIQSTLVVIALVLSFVATNTNSIGDDVTNYVRVGSLCVVILINFMERFIFWCLHGVTSLDDDGSWNFYADIARTIATEIMLYPALMFTLHGLTTTDSYQMFFADKSVNATNTEQDLTVGFALLTVIGVSFMLTAGVMRMYLVVCAVKSLLRARKSNRSNADLSVKTFLYGFCVYAGAQCVIQALMILCVGIYFHEAPLSQDFDDGIKFDSRMKWILAVFAEFVPLSALFLFFITTQKLIEEFPIALLLDIPPSQERSRIINMEVVTIQFKGVHSRNMSPKGILKNILYPLSSPVQGLAHIIFLPCCLHFISYMLITSFSQYHLLLEIVSIITALLVLLFDFPFLLYGFVSLVLCALLSCFMCPILLFFCVKPNALRNGS